MSKFIALTSLMFLGLFSVLGNYWFTYGLWPKSWFSFIGFGVLSVTIAGLAQLVNKE